MKKQSKTKAAQKMNKLSHDERKAKAERKAQLRAERRTAAERAEREAALEEARASVFGTIKAPRPAVVLDLVTGGPTFSVNEKLTAFRRRVVVNARAAAEREAERACIERLTRPSREAGRVTLTTAFARVGL